MGLGTFKNAWQRQAQYFGHEQESRYTVLILDNRGMGESDKPLARYSTSEMAKDTLEVINHLGWTSPRQLHVVGVSMGGMIAQELVGRLRILNLLSCLDLYVYVLSMHRVHLPRLSIPKSPDVQLDDVKARMFSQSWLEAPDESGKFPTNGDWVTAFELAKRQDTEGFTRKGFISQALAAGWHHKSPEQLKELADKVGRRRIQVLHGTVDKMITVPHAETLARELGEEAGVTKIIVEGRAHVLHMEEKQMYKQVLERMMDKVESLS
ncbi:MAG: hypothetical protein Q9179_001533 [Wetmoreana sp. 5 TL-2023]